MKRFAEIHGNEVRKIYEQEKEPLFASYIKVIDMTNMETQPQEGWYYDETTNTFSEEIQTESQPTVEEIQERTLLNTEYLVVLSEVNNA